MQNKRKFCSIFIAIMTIGFSSAPVFASNAPFTTDELHIIQQHLLDNITTDSNVIKKNNVHSIPGAVLASPSAKSDHFSQDYQYHWTRDAALAMSEVVYLYSQANGAEKKMLKDYLLNYIDFVSKVHAGVQSLGEPKFNIDGTVWTGPWGRPQNDGPALRAITMMEMANLFLNDGNEKIVRKKILNLVTTDLDYVVSVWQQSTFGLWEEVNDKDHFFTKMVQRKALIAGAAFLKRMNENARANNYLSTAQQMTASLQNHWNESLGYFSETIHQQNYKGGGLDSSVLLGFLYGNLHDVNDSFALNNDRVMNTVYFMRNSFAPLYKINQDNPNIPPMIGRYPGDIYDGDQFRYGNPWILTTNALAQYYYSLANIYMKKGRISITKNNILFFQQLNSHKKIKEQVIFSSKNSKEFSTIINDLIAEGDNILENVKHYSTCYPDHTCYHFAEQIDRDSGEQVSAKDLTWGYATFLTAMQARDGYIL